MRQRGSEPNLSFYRCCRNQLEKYKQKHYVLCECEDCLDCVSPGGETVCLSQINAARQLAGLSGFSETRTTELWPSTETKKEAWRPVCRALLPVSRPDLCGYLFCLERLLFIFSTGDTFHVAFRKYRRMLKPYKSPERPLQVERMHSWQ